MFKVEFISKFLNYFTIKYLKLYGCFTAKHPYKYNERIATLTVNEKIKKMEVFKIFNPETDYKEIVTSIESNLNKY